ncbi:NfeD family protein [Polaromonas jejuensis]|uniref:Nodulation protein NfeD n=1 Tax=Polaromonas jejuensis TaxID=457502 RepID=A0ABW0Q5V5_9BURK|nr:nodulation protein NfeD [Polaromonas jejuensis]
MTAATRRGKRGIFLFCAFLLALLLLVFAIPAVSATPVLVLQVQDAIGPASADYVIQGLRKAKDSGAPLVVIELDTPGGLDISMRKIIQAMLASPVPVAIYVHPSGARAASAGTYMLYAAHIAAMAPATTLGAATPVAIGLPGVGRGPPEKEGPADKNKNTDKEGGKAAKPDAKPATPPADTMTTKQVNDAAAFIRGLAQLRGRNAVWAERAVREAVTLTASEALRDKVIDVVAKDLPDLLGQIDGRTVHVQASDVKLATRGLPYETRLPDWRQELLSVIANPSFALILMMLGMYGLITEFSSSTFGIAGVAGAICLLLALFALQLLPVNYAGLALILLGMGMLVAELFLPTFGVIGLGGVVAFIAGAILLFDSDAPGFGVPLPLILALAATSAAVILLGGGMALKARRRPVVSGREEMTGAPGEVLEVADGEAWARVRGERWRVSSPQPLAPGQRIHVLGLHGLTLDVQIDTETPTKTQGVTS